MFVLHVIGPLVDSAKPSECQGLDNEQIVDQYWRLSEANLHGGDAIVRSLCPVSRVINRGATNLPQQ